VIEPFKRVWIVIAALLLLAACSGSAGETTPTESSIQTAGPVSPTATPSPTEIPQLASTDTQPPTPVAQSVPTLTSESLPTPTETEQAESASSLPDPQGYTWEVVFRGLEEPIGFANAGDGSGRAFILEKAGRIRIAQDGQVLSEPFLDIRDRVGSGGSEQGLLGLAFHPAYSENGYFYVNYTDRNGNTVIARFTVNSDDPNRADPRSEKALLNVQQPYPNHNGGSTVFGPDGYLYLGLGDGGSAGDPQGNAQSTDTFLGKILRLDVDSGDPYGIPPGNPFVDGGGRPEIWAYGLRNPWRFSFDLANGDLYIGDVGQNQWEEIDYLPAGPRGGVNFGWDYFEATHPYEGTPPQGLETVPPVAEYSHSNGCSVTGGYVYRGQSLPEWQGVYIYGDYCSGIVWGLLRRPDGNWENQILFQTGFRITSFGQDEAGEVYLVAYAGGIYRLAQR
jgi:glucose/arabinose dehydrogenase